MEFNGSNNFTNEDYLQMSGRAGRRGQDNKGNIIFYGDIDYLSLMKGYLPNITGNNKNINNSYKILNNINPSIKNNHIDKVFNYFLNNDRNIINTDIIYDNPKLSWYLRNYENANDFVEELDDIESYLFRNKVDTDLYLLEKIYDLIECLPVDNEYKSNKLDDNVLEKLNIFYEIFEVIINIYNNINKDKYLLIRQTIKTIYDNIKTIMIKYNGFK
tara:strand:- start:68 stop:715 length:648 start_codon:yes stop_codon:yes gene_type:complete